MITNLGGINMIPILIRSRMISIIKCESIINKIIFSKTEKNSNVIQFNINLFDGFAFSNSLNVKWINFI